MPVEPEKSLPKRGWRALQAVMLKNTSLRDIKRAHLGLFHGKSVFDAYATFSKNPHIVHDIHLTEEDLIDDSALERRLAQSQDPFRILYVGRVHPMKGPLEWIDALQRLLETTPALKGRLVAEWIGDGPLLNEARLRVNSLGLEAFIRFPGAENDRGKLLGILRSADLFVFCHLTPESPRCLIEALMSAVPIVGFQSPYARDLLAETEAGVLVPVGDTVGLAAKIQSLINESARLARCSRDAFKVGRRFSAAAVFKHRSDLIKQYLSESSP